MASFAPAECSPCAIAHAIDRLLATPNTTAVFPFKSSNMKNSGRMKSRSYEVKSYEANKNSRALKSRGTLLQGILYSNGLFLLANHLPRRYGRLLRLGRGIV